MVTASEFSERTTNSSMFNSFLASPPDNLNIASVSLRVTFFLDKYSSLSIARFKRASKSVLLNDSSTYT